MSQAYKIIRNEHSKKRPLWLVYILYNIYPSLYIADTYKEASHKLKTITSLVKESSFIKKSLQFYEDENHFKLLTSKNKEVISFSITSASI